MTAHFDLMTLMECFGEREGLIQHHERHGCTAYREAIDQWVADGAAFCEPGTEHMRNIERLSVEDEVPGHVSAFTNEDLVAMADDMAAKIFERMQEGLR